MQHRVNIILITVFSWLAISFAGNSQVTVSEKTITIKTYHIPEPDHNPVFSGGKSYMGVKKLVYPYPLMYNLSDSIADRDYNAVIMENEYIEICIIPELGGRIYYARDKRNDYYFLYYNRVIKPAVTGMTGAWVSGGLQWNIPHFHRSASFVPAEYTVTDGPDGSRTVWTGQTELWHGTRWIAGITLRPGSILAEATHRMFNTTHFQNTFMAWSAAAVHANSDYQVFLPPSTQFITSYGRNQFSEWPVSRQYYDGEDYTMGVDLSRRENHRNSTSFFEWGNNGNFIAGIDHGQNAGTVLFGDKHLNPGKKIVSWVNNPAGAIWEDLLTDDDGPIIELMLGSFSDNQPGYNWIQALETRESKFALAPLLGMSGIKKINENAIADLDLRGDSLFVTINAVRNLGTTEVTLYRGDSLIYKSAASLSPDEPYRFNDGCYRAGN
jgi:hypothetical protein